MYPTTEIRWFLEGELPEGLSDRMTTTLGDRLRSPARTDVYLRQPDRDDLGIKLREGRFELKQRLEECGPLTIGPALTGALERWTKWSFPLTSDPSLDLEPDHWLAVTKTRRLWFSEHDGATVQVELSELRLDGAVWWSLCLEASGPDDDCDTAIHATLEALDAEAGLPVLDATTTGGYPRFLNRATGAVTPRPSGR